MIKSVYLRVCNICSLSLGGLRAVCLSAAGLAGLMGIYQPSALHMEVREADQGNIQSLLEFVRA